MATINVKSSDGVVLTIDIATACYSNTIKNSLQLMGMFSTDVVIPVPNVTGYYLKMFIEWAEHHKNNPAEAHVAAQNGGISLWDQQFLNRDTYVLVELLNAANYLGAKMLVDITCLVIARQIEANNPGQMRQLFIV